MKAKPFLIEWDGTKYYTSDEVFSPRQSSIEILNQIYHATKIFNESIPIIDMCCGIGSIGVSSYLKFPKAFNYYLGLDNDNTTVKLCKKNIALHSINGHAQLWEAGDKIPYYPKGIVTCNPPFLTLNQKYDERLQKESFVFGGESGIGVILKCFQSVINSSHIFVLKSFSNQIKSISKEVGAHFSLIKQKEFEFEKDYTLAFTTWRQI